ncbi:MAG TPA: hypothetical protein VFE46_03180 [Pirellulales bacterium]|jgi:hypothetical protein|nr:hypothetical protein [Pirellulales bacterium]
MTQLSLVEHSLCPLDTEASLRPGLIHEAGYFFTDKDGTRRKATARVISPEGLSAYDELYLWGLLALTFSQAEPGVEFTATPHYCLRQLGLIEDKHHRGGETYRLFRDAIERLSAVTYQNDNFYDPIRGEHCRVGFGFLSYRLPLNSDSSRAWRFYWDPLLFEICQATGSALAFDLETYRQLDTATRRLYLLLKKMFWKKTSSLHFDVRHLGVNVLGYSPTLKPWRLKEKLIGSVRKLVDQGILAPPPEGSMKNLFRKQHKGQYSILFQRGPNFDRTTTTKVNVDSPHYELLQAIGFEQPAIARLLRTYPPRLIGEWADITLAARERNGEKFFTTSAQAFFVDNIKHAAAGTRTPPDWWRELRKLEEQQRRRHAADNSDLTLDQYLKTEAREAFARVTDRIFGDLIAGGKTEAEAREQADRIARNNLKVQFYREHPECRPTDPPTNPIVDHSDE